LMKMVAEMPNGHVIFPALLDNSADIGRTDPYWSIKRFGGKIETVDSGPSRIGFFNKCFSNDLSGDKMDLPDGIRRIDALSESDEARAVAEIAARAKSHGESVLIITPDAAGGQRIVEALAAYDLSVDSSAGTPVSKTRAGRIAGMICDLALGAEKPEVVNKDLELAGPVADGGGADLFAKISGQVGQAPAEFWTAFEKARELSEKHGLDVAGAAAVLIDALGRESVRPPIGDFDVVILGTAEARMQTADVVVLTGLNEGIFPADGFSHPWISRTAAESIGLPSPDAKVSLQALDFMTLSCAPKVFWTRSKMSGGAATTPSRFLSRIAAKVRDMPVEIAARKGPLQDKAGQPDIPVYDYKGPYWATWLEDLIHNPYQFYAKHILHLRKLPDIGDDVGAREFGTMVHHVLEECIGADESEIIRMLEAAAEKIVPRASVLFRFWQNRFREMAPAIAALPAGAELEKEISGEIFGRRIRAKADRIEPGRVVDYKTGAVPTKTQLGLGKDADCTMPQLPVEAILTGAREMAFLRLQRRHVGMVGFDEAETAAAIEAAKNKLGFLFAQNEYGRPDHYLDEKYRDFDDMARVP
jgi:RecB family exonuclease